MNNCELDICAMDGWLVYLVHLVSDTTTAGVPGTVVHLVGDITTAGRALVDQLYCRLRHDTEMVD